MNDLFGQSASGGIDKGKSAEQKRIERIRAGRSQRRKPASIPARLARTSAFAPKRQNFITDSRYERVFEVRGHSVIKVSGRELGTPHRDALIAVYRLPHEQFFKVSPSDPTKREGMYQTRVTWRELVVSTGRTEHVNNVVYLMELFEEMKKVVITSYEVEGRDTGEVMARLARGERLPDETSGGMGNVINDIRWSGLGLDDYVTIEYGSFSVRAFEKAALVSLNADVQNALNSDHAKTFWPYIDSMRGFKWVDEDVLAELCGRRIWDETKNQRGQFRRDCRDAFDDMVRAGGLLSWDVELRGRGFRKGRRYHYEKVIADRPRVTASLALPKCADDAVVTSTDALQRVSELKLSDTAYVRAREKAPGWDIPGHLEPQFRLWLADKDIVPRSVDAMFVAFCERWRAKHGALA